MNVALFAPAFAFKKDRFESGVKTLRERYGIKPLFLDSIFERDGYFAGSDERRLNEIYHWITNDEADALLAIRGGYGCSRIYPKLAEKLKNTKNLKPKKIIGYSDLTVFLNGLLEDFGFEVFHGPVVVGRAIANPKPIEESTFKAALGLSEKLKKIDSTSSDCDKIRVLHQGSATAPLVGGCLSLLTAAIGTSYDVNMDGKILFIEDVGERPYRIDRMITQLLHAGKLENIKGLIIGEMADCNPPSVEEFGSATPDITTAIKKTLAPFIEKKNIPVIFDFPAGHGGVQCTLPLGKKVTLNAGKIGELIFE